MDISVISPDGTRLAVRRSGAAPTLVVQGELTWPPMPATIETLVEALPSPQRVVLGGQLHFATHTAPDAVAAAVLPFLRDHAAGGGT